jgi:hypothetical protein
MNTQTTSNSIQQIVQTLHSKGYRMCEILDALLTAQKITGEIKQIEQITWELIKRK